MHAIVIADSLTNDFMNAAEPYRQVKVNVGEMEIERLMGAGADYGRGVLPAFLRLVLDARRGGAAVGLVLLRDHHDPRDPAQRAELDRFGEHAIAGTEGAAFVEPIADLVEQAEVIDTATLGLPLGGFRAAVERLSGIDPLAVEDPAACGLRFLLVGCHTDKRVLGTASVLRNVLGIAQVAVSPHLVASSSREAHFATLRQALPDALVQVLADIDDAARFVGLDPAPLSAFGCRPCAIAFTSTEASLGPDQRAVVEALCMHLDAVTLQPLAGGFSGSVLCLAHGTRDGARTEPMVLKVDGHAQMRKELAGYEQVKDLVGKQVPSFASPVSAGAYTGVAMELAAMEGKPQTLQDSFIEAVDEAGLARFERRLDAALAVLGGKLQGNTRATETISPYRALGLHTADQRTWLADNVAHIIGDSPGHPVLERFRAVTTVHDTVDSETALSHGDLNLANVICDDKDNVWLIDWTHAARAPIELDFAKLENDLKFVASIRFGDEDVAHLEAFERHVLDERVPADGAALGETLQFVGWDFRFRKLLRAVRRIRYACFALKGDEDWLVYRVALLRYAVHTLSFDRRRGKGECDLGQLRHALFSVEALVERLAGTPFHLDVPLARPASYPPRTPVRRAERGWDHGLPGYDPAYHLDEAVKAATTTTGGWADPEPRPADMPLPLNPAGRTGLAGRGLLGRWGANQAVDAVVIRSAEDGSSLELLIGIRNDSDDLALPGSFVRPGETSAEALARCLAEKTGWTPQGEPLATVHDGYVYDFRETDHAWIETRAYLHHVEGPSAPLKFRPGAGLREVGWKVLTADLTNALYASHATLVREALHELARAGLVAGDTADDLLEATG